MQASRCASRDTDLGSYRRFRIEAPAAVERDSVGGCAPAEDLGAVCCRGGGGGDGEVGAFAPSGGGGGGGSERAVLHPREALRVVGPGGAGRVPHAAAPLEHEGEGGERERQQREEEEHPRGEGRGRRAAPAGGGGGGGAAAVARHGMGGRPVGGGGAVRSRWLYSTLAEKSSVAWHEWA